MELEEDLPTFRPFTREELNTIENRIFENKLATKETRNSGQKHCGKKITINEYYTLDK